MLLCYDVLISTGDAAISDGFIPDEIFRELQHTYCYSEMTGTSGGDPAFSSPKAVALQQYDEFRKVR